MKQHRTVALLAAGLALAGCNGSNADTTAYGTGDNATVNRYGGAISNGSSSADDQTTTPTDTATATTETIYCSGDVKAFLSAEEDLDGRLDIGLSYSDYADRLGTARVKYNAIDPKNSDAGCVNRVALPAQAALQHYVAAYTAWQKCVGSLSCNDDSIKPKLQRQWSIASRNIAAAKAALDA